MYSFKNFNSYNSVQFAKNHINVPIIIVCIYLILIVIGKKYMEYRKPFKLKKILIFWNGLLSIFSFMGMISTTPKLINLLYTTNFSKTICTPCKDSWAKGLCGFWVTLFIYSKIPELFDTFFVISRKKPLLFLHWYHHISVLLYCWHSYATEASQALYFVCMNYSVHSIMYGYYCLMILNIKPKWFNPMFITICQILQMLVGTVIQFISLYKYIYDSSCKGLNKENIIWGGLMYISYFVLFTNFAICRYIKIKNKS